MAHQSAAGERAGDPQATPQPLRHMRPMQVCALGLASARSLKDGATADSERDVRADATFGRALEFATRLLPNYPDEGMPLLAEMLDEGMRFGSDPQARMRMLRGHARLVMAVEVRCEEALNGGTTADGGSAYDGEVLLWLRRKCRVTCSFAEFLVESGTAESALCLFSRASVCLEPLRDGEGHLSRQDAALAAFIARETDKLASQL